MPILLSKLAAPALTLLLLVGIGVEKYVLHVPPGDSKAYHRLIRMAVEDIPMNAGPWEGTDEKILRAVVQLLRPNVIFNRRYFNRQTGQFVTVLLVQCIDARDIVGHYPPVCYPANGWSVESAEPRQWSNSGLHITGCEYRFRSFSLERTSEIIVKNFLLLPDGTTVSNMDGVIQSAKDYRRRHYGASQVQVLTDASMSPKDREQVFQLMLTQLAPVIKAIGSGIQ